MREYIERRKETLTIMAFIIKSHNYPDSEVFQFFAESSIAELMEDLLSELTIVLIAHANHCSLTNESATLPMSAVVGYDTAAERKKWLAILGQL